MIDNMEFVYSLSCEGSVFYIGRTKHLARRYKRHLTGYELLEVHVYIKERIALGKSIKMNMLYYMPHAEATRKEFDLIQLFTKSGQKLYNVVGVAALDMDTIPDNVDSDTMAQRLISQQEHKENIHIFWQEHYNTKNTI